MISTTIKIYTRIAMASVKGDKAVPSPFFLIRDADPLDEVAALAGLVKNVHEALEFQTKRIARLTAVTAPQEEERARALLESLIDAKQSFMAAHKRLPVEKKINDER